MDKFDNFVVTYDTPRHRWLTRNICLENDVDFLIEFAENRYSIYTLDFDGFLKSYHEEELVFNSIDLPSSVLAKALMIYP